MVFSCAEWFLSQEIEKGSDCGDKISQALNDMDIGIVCLTRTNTEAPWILFEAGALSKNRDSSRVFTVLFGLTPADVKPPLGKFQHTEFNEEDIKRLVRSMNGVHQTPYDQTVIDSVAATWWPNLKKEVDSLKSTEEEGSSMPLRSDRELIEEILTTLRDERNELIGEVRNIRSHSPSSKPVDKVDDFSRFVIEGRMIIGIPDDLPLDQADQIRSELKKKYPYIRNSIIHLGGIGMGAIVNEMEPKTPDEIFTSIRMDFARMAKLLRDTGSIDGPI